EPGSVVLDASATRTPVIADGEPVDGRRVLSAAEVERGVVLLLGGRVVLLLHRLERRLPGEAPSDDPPAFGLVGASDAIVRLRREIERLATLDVAVLLLGETGTGKELAARALHDAGPRRERPFVAVNMGVPSPTLAAAELFGAVRGAYTGADRNKQGYFRSAQHGTLFLDEIGETPPEVQVMLLRALESDEIQPVGSTAAQKIDVRVIAATDAHLDEALAAGRFRAPLYHRLAGYTVHLPALRERRDDVGRLLYFFLAEELAELGVRPPAADDERPWPPAEVVARLARHDWPGNVRELHNVARRLAIAGRCGDEASLLRSLEDLLAETSPAPEQGPEPSAADTVGSAPAGVRRRPSDIREEEFTAALRTHRWRIKDTAEVLGISRAALYKLIDQSSGVRKASELGREEIAECHERCSGDVDAMVDALEVSKPALRRRMRQFGLE
ncbi:MAG: sigma-54 dependent transcriptional regulator, partial [Thermoanaerobaculia bacterium]